MLEKDLNRLATTVAFFLGVFLDYVFHLRGGRPGFLLVGVTAGGALYQTGRLWWKTQATGTLTEFQKRFPGRCPICSCHDYGVRAGHIPPGPVGEHRCLEARKET